MKRFSVIYVILLVGIGVMLNSCVEREEFNLSENNPILRFSISSEEVKTRAAVAAEEESVEEADTVCWSVMEVEGDEDFSEPLYLTMVTEDREAVAADEYVSEEVQTRGAPVSTSTFASMHSERGFGLFAYVYKPDTWDENSTTSEYIHNRPVHYYDNSYWGLFNASSYEQYHWPGANYKVRFYAYAPISGGYKDNTFVPGYYRDIIKVQSGAYKGVPKIPITVSKNNKAASGKDLTTHPDLVIAKTAELPGNRNQKQPLEFKHVMAAISFKVGAMFADDAVKITKIEFQNVLHSGTINLETQQWENIGTDKATITLTKDIAISGDNGQQGGLTAEDYFMMLPQTLPSDAKVVVTFVLSSDGTTEHTVETSMGGIKWEMGHLHIYTLTAKLTPTDEYTFTVNTAPSNTSTSYTSPSATYLGGVSTTGNITSYLTHTNVFGIQTKEAVEWTTEYSTDGGATWTTTRPEFFSSFTAGADGKTEGTDEIEGVIAPITPSDPKNPFGPTVDERPVSTTTINLADPNDKDNYTTANCYVVNKAGTYTFPLVYGNAIKDGAADPNEYYKKFKDHDGIAIKSPFIHPEKLNKAKLLWTDAPNLIKDVKLSDADQTMTIAGTAVRYITFTVPKEHLAPGNAVIAICDSNGVIMWSWHIWVTTWNGTSVTVTSNSKTFNFSNTILGYCPSRDAKWKERSVKVRFRQNGSNKVSLEDYSFTQSGYTNQYSEGNMPYYQWGRKDPLLMYNYITDVNGTSTGGSEKVCFGLGDPKDVPMKVWTGGAYVDYAEEKQGGYDGYFSITPAYGASGVTMGESIKNPYTFYPRRTDDDMKDAPEYDWCNEMGYNRWDATNMANVASDTETGATVKTIYDPCPPGWCVPPVGAFYAFTSGKASPGSMTTMGGDDSRTPAFKAKPNGGKVEVILPITGDRSRYFGAPWWTSLASRNVQLWTATPTTYKSYTTCAFYVSSYKVKSSGYYYFSSSGLAKSSGFAVLPVKE